MNKALDQIEVIQVIEGGGAIELVEVLEELWIDWSDSSDASLWSDLKLFKSLNWFDLFIDS